MILLLGVGPLPVLTWLYSRPHNSLTHTGRVTGSRASVTVRVAFMTFDEQLQRSLGTLADRLRDEIARAFLAAGADVTAHANEARDAAVQEASARARAGGGSHCAQSRSRASNGTCEEMTAASASLEQATRRRRGRAPSAWSTPCARSIGRRR